MTNSKFIIVKHDAKKARLHYDLRFRMPNSINWMSFAVRKGLPTTPGQKVLAIRTHDHTEKEALFLGTIESGYGAGKLSKYDDGQCIIEKFSPSHITIDFKGKKIKGIYHLINTGVFNKKDYKKQQYLLFKGKIVSEIMGLCYLLPPDKSEDTDPPDSYGNKLSWNKSNRIKAAEQLYKMLKRYVKK